MVRTRLGSLAKSFSLGDFCQQPRSTRFLAVEPIMLMYSDSGGHQVGETQDLGRPVAVVTGAAMGIGRAVAERLVEEGWRVIGVDVDDEALSGLHRRLPQGDFVALHGDVSDSNVLRTAADLGDQDGRLAGWVNNAGIEISASAHDLVEQDLRRVLDVDLVAVALGCAEAVRRFRAHGGGGGAIVNVGSIQALQGFDRSLPYQAAKGGVSALTRQIAVEYAPESIRCNCVLPGAVDTEMTAALVEAAEDPSSLLDEYRALQPIGRLIHPTEVAAAVWFLLSNDSSAITGVDLRVDGGAVVRGGRAGSTT